MSTIHISYSVINFNCPYCDKEYVDEDDKYLDKINRNKQGYTTLICECGKRFGVAYDRNGLVAFKLKEVK